MLELLAPSKGGVPICRVLENGWTNRISQNRMMPHLGKGDNGWYAATRYAVDSDQKINGLGLAELLLSRFSFSEDVGRLASVLCSMSPAGAMAAASLELKKKLDWRQPDRFPFDASVRPDNLGVSMKHILAVSFNSFRADRFKDMNPQTIFTALDELNTRPERIEKYVYGRAEHESFDDFGSKETRVTGFPATPDTLRLLMNSDPLFLKETLEGAMMFSERVTGVMRRNKLRLDSLSDPGHFESYAGGADW